MSIPPIVFGVYRQACATSSCSRLCATKAIVDYMQIRMTLVQDIKQQILFVKSPTREWNVQQCISINVPQRNDSYLWKLIETTIESYGCQETVSKLSLKLYDSCLKPILQSLFLSLIFHPGFQKTLLLQSFNTELGLICCAPQVP